MKRRSLSQRFVRCCKGMTLLEIMLAILILSTVVTMVSMSLSGSLDVMNATREQGEIYHRARVALLRISEDIASAVLLDDVDFVGTDEQVGDGEGDTLRFSSTGHVVLNPDKDNPGIAVIAYRVEEDPDREGELVLLRSDTLLASPGAASDQGDQAEAFVLSDRLRSVNFSYFNSEGEELEVWTTEVEENQPREDRMLPVAVSCTLEYWLDRESETSLEFSTSVLLPVGLISAQKE